MKKITETTSIKALCSDLKNYERRMYTAENGAYFTDFPQQLSSINCIFSPLVTATKLNGNGYQPDIYGSYILLEVTGFDGGTGIPKTINGIFNWKTGAMAWNGIY